VRVPHLPRSRASRTLGLPLHPSQRAPVPTLRIESASCSNRLAAAQLLLPNSLCYNRLSAPLLLCACFCCTPTSTYLVLLTEPKLLWTPEHFTQMSTPMLADAHLESGALQSAQKRFSLLCNNSFSLAIVAEAPMSPCPSIPSASRWLRAEPPVSHLLMLRATARAASALAARAPPSTCAVAARTGGGEGR
jgi:hypothetical protein